jgi:peptidoglycan/LPS O-acetylase OafA/YrhL
MSNVVFAISFMAVSLVAALAVAMQSDRPKSFIYAVGLGSMLAQIVVLFVVLRIAGSPLGTAHLPSLGTACAVFDCARARQAF